MSFLARLFGTERSGLSGALELDLKRLKAVATSMGEGNASLGLKNLSPADQLHHLNRYLGDCLGSCSALERTVIQQKIASADRILPAELRTAKPPSLYPQTPHTPPHTLPPLRPAL